MVSMVENEIDPSIAVKVAASRCTHDVTNSRQTSPRRSVACHSQDTGTLMSCSGTSIESVPRMRLFLTTNALPKDVVDRSCQNARITRAAFTVWNDRRR